MTGEQSRSALAAVRGNKLKGFSARAAFEAITYVFFGTLSGDIENLKAMRALRGRVVLAQRPISKLIGKNGHTVDSRTFRSKD